MNYNIYALLFLNIYSFIVYFFFIVTKGKELSKGDVLKYLLLQITPICNIWLILHAYY